MADLSPEDRITKERVPVLAGVMRRLRARRPPVVPHEGPVDGEQRTGGRSGALRAGIFGANDGLVSNLSLIMGVAGAGAENEIVILAGVAGLLAGAFSMAAGEYISMRVQREVFERLIHLEAHEIGTDHAGEREELAELYRRKGISAELADRLADELMRDPQMALETHAREELGLDPQEGLGSPWAAAVSSFATFAAGALVPLVPFWFGSGDGVVIASAVLSILALFAVGSGMSYLTGRSFVVSGLRMMLIGAAAAAITYAVGSLLEVGTSTI